MPAYPLDVLRTKFLLALREKRPKKSSAVLFHHDSAVPHRAARLRQFFDDNNFEVVPHARYSPDLAPSDFWLFPTLKDTLRGRTFSSGHNEPPKKRLLRPCSRGISAVKNMYV
jgi:histone-lysine N-methyltransferase SETMAR